MVYALLLGACESGTTPRKEPARNTAPETPTAQQTAATVAKQFPLPTTKKPSVGIEWAGNIDWLSYEAGFSKAKSEKKPLCVVVYADWCPRCKELAQVFRQPQIERLAKDLVMVRQNADEPSEWLNTPPLAAHGKYVPRVFFFDRKGSFDAAITSGHPRYPFFYAAAAPQMLTSSMQKAIALPL
ncbi:MAG: thioredoxin family protein [Polyangiaceae bacterium]